MPEVQALISVMEQGFRVSMLYRSQNGDSTTISVKKNIGYYFVEGSPNIKQHISQIGEFFDSVDIYKTRIPEDAIDVFIKLKEQSDKN